VAKNRQGALSDLKRKFDEQLASALPQILKPGEEMSVSTWGEVARNPVVATLWGREVGHPGFGRMLLSLSLQLGTSHWTDITFLVLTPTRLLVVSGGGKKPLQLREDHPVADITVRRYRGPSFFGGDYSRLDLAIEGRQVLWFRTTRDWSDGTELLARRLGWESSEN
jgi:hypothetical protein